MSKGESLRIKTLRWGFNWWSAYRATGARISYIREDYREVRLELPFNWWTRSPKKAIFGGLMYACIDPVHVMMYAYVLGLRNVATWTKSATVNFRRQARCTLYSHFEITEPQLNEVKAGLSEAGKVDMPHQAMLWDQQGQVYTTVDYLVHIRQRA